MVAGHAFVNHVQIGDGTSRRQRSLQAGGLGRWGRFCVCQCLWFLCLLAITSLSRGSR